MSTNDLHATHALVQGTLYRETEKAICLDICPRGFVWFPKKSCIIERCEAGINLWVPWRLAREKRVV